MRSQEEPGGASRSQEKPKGVRRSQEPGGAKKSQEEPGAARRSQEEPRGARRSREEPGKDSKNQWGGALPPFHPHTPGDQAFGQIAKSNFQGGQGRARKKAGRTRGP